MNNLVLKTIFILTSLSILQWCFAQNPVKIIVNTDIEKEKINKHIYGHCAVHLDRCGYDDIYNGEN